MWDISVEKLLNPKSLAEGFYRASEGRKKGQRTLKHSVATEVI